MSIKASTESGLPEPSQANNAIEMIIQPKEHDLGGFVVRRALPAPSRRMIGPWIFFDHMGPAVFTPGEGVNVRPHPHINLATVTYLFEGEMLHRDSLGNELAIKPGEINLMVAGKGIVHSERQSEKIKEGENKLNGLQLWMALPEAVEEIDPEFHHYDSSMIPTINIDDVQVRVLIGSAYNVSSPVKTFADTLYFEAFLEKGQELLLPVNVMERGLYIVNGKLEINGSHVEQHTMTVLHSAQEVLVKAEQDTKLVVIGGESLSRRHIWWNFVSSRKERIEQAKREWKQGMFPKVPGDEVEFIPLPD